MPKQVDPKELEKIEMLVATQPTGLSREEIGEKLGGAPNPHTLQRYLALLL